MKKKLFKILMACVVGVAVLVGGAGVETVRAHNDKINGTAEVNDGGSGKVCGGSFLGFRAWYAGLTDGACNVKWPKATDGVKSDKIVPFVWAIILNIMSTLISLSGVVMLGMMVKGGFDYITSDGDPGKVAKAKSTITNDVVGMIIVIFATVIVNTIIQILIKGL